MASVWDEFSDQEPEQQPSKSVWDNIQEPTDYDIAKQEVEKEAAQNPLIKMGKDLIVDPAVGIYEMGKSAIVDTGKGLISGARMPFQEPDARSKAIYGPLANPVTNAYLQDAETLARAGESAGLGMGSAAITKAMELAEYAKNNPGKFAVAPLIAPYLQKTFGTMTEAQKESAIERNLINKSMGEEAGAALSQSPNPELSKGLPNALNTALMLDGISVLKPAPSIKATASRVVAEPIQFSKPVKGQVTGKMSTVFDAKDKAHIARSLSPDEAVADGLAEAIRHSPDTTTDLVGINASAGEAINKLVTEVRELKRASGSEANPMNVVADKLEGMIHKGMSPEHQDEIRKAAAKYRNQDFTVDDIHKTLKYLGDQNVPFWLNPDKNAKFSSQLIADERSILNNEFLNIIEKAGGPRARELNKTMSNLIKLQDAIEVKTKKLANTIPPKLRGSLFQAETTANVLFGLSNLLSNPAAAGVALTNAALKASKAAQKEFLTNPNAMLGKVNESLRKKVKIEGDVYTPKPIPPILKSSNIPQGYTPESWALAQQMAGVSAPVVRQGLSEIPLAAETLSQMQGIPVRPPTASSINTGRMSGSDVGNAIPQQGMSYSQNQLARQMAEMESPTIRPPLIPESIAAMEHIGKASRDVPKPPEKSFGKEFTDQKDFQAYMRKLERDKKDADTKAEKARIQRRIDVEKQKYEEAGYGQQYY